AAPVKRRRLVGLGHVAGDQDAVGDPGGGHGRGQLPRAPAGQAGQDQAVGERGGEGGGGPGGRGGDAPDEGGQVLAGLDGPQPEQVGAVQAEAGSEVGDLLLGGRCQVGAERGHVDPAGGDPEPLGQVGGGGGG